MRLLGDRFNIDLACLPIGGNYTMDAEQAAEKAAKMLKTKMVFPIHYGTFPPLAGKGQYGIQGKNEVNDSRGKSLGS